MPTTATASAPIGELSAALDAFVALLGADSVITDASALLELRDPFTYRESDEWDAAAAVLPTTTEQVSEVVKIANRFGIPLWTFSQGRNNTYGGPAPRVKGAVIVNLRTMNRVLEIDEDLAFAVVEPGVRWFDLYDALEKAGGRLWTSIPDLGWGSVVGNSSEYGRGYTPYGDHAENICGLEVVLPDGEILRTGMGGLTGSKSAHIYKHAFGPHLQGLFQSSGLGIITRMGYWLQRRPEAYASCWLSFQGDAALEASVDRMRELMLDGTVTNYPVILHGVELDDDGNPSFSREQDTWLTRFALYGRPEIVDANWAACERVFGDIPGLTLRRRVYAGTDRTSHAGHEDRVMAGIPDMDILELFQSVYGPDTAHLDFSPVGPLRGTDVVETAHLMRGLYEETGERFFSGLMLSPRSVIHISTMFFDPHDETQTASVYANYSAMLDVMRERGYPIYRTNLQHMDAVAAQFDFNDNILLRVNERIKDALEPNGILQPGKSGIWARRYREVDS